MTKEDSKLRNKQIPLTMSSEEADYFASAKKMLESEKGRNLSNREFVMVLCHRYRKDGLNADKAKTTTILETNDDTLMQLIAIIDKQVEENKMARNCLNNKEDE